MTSNNNFSYFLLGLGIGAGFALLMAPQSGAKTRNYLQTKAQEGSDHMRRQGLELRDMANETLERGKQTVREQVKSVADAVEAGKQAYRDSVGIHG